MVSNAEADGNTPDLPLQAPSATSTAGDIPLLSLPGPVLVTGARGFVGRNVVTALGDFARPYVHETVDITDRDDIELVLRTERPWAVINCAALADVDRSDREPELAWRVNGVGPGLLAEACAARDIRLLHVSTDYVFGAGHTDGPLSQRYRVTDAPCPINHYGASKAEGEKRVLEAHPRAIIARIAWVFGPHGGGFAGQLPYRLARGERIEAIHDRQGHPTFVTDAVARMLSLLMLGVPGIYHVVNQGPTSWYAFAARLAERLGLPPDRVRPVSRLELPPRASRPVQVPLDEDPRRPGVPFPPLRPWQEAQDAWIRALVLVAEDALKAQARQP